MAAATTTTTSRIASPQTTSRARALVSGAGTGRAAGRSSAWASFSPAARMSASDHDTITTHRATANHTITEIKVVVRRRTCHWVQDLIAKDHRSDDGKYTAEYACSRFRRVT